VDYLPGMTTGISALERARTLNALADRNGATAQDFVRPGHVFPLRYQHGGVLVRSGHTEAAVDLCRLAGASPAGALCELVNDDGTMKRLPDLLQFADEHDLPIISIESLIRYRTENDVLVERIASKPVTFDGRDLRVEVYRTTFEDKYITAVVKGEIDGEAPTLVRVVKGAKDRAGGERGEGPGFPVQRCRGRECGQPLPRAHRRSAAGRVHLPAAWQRAAP
jgi:3,4-dihydroxy 2-butanone 4-phosphate synthase/GTP cyclohydrolase II